MVSSTGLQEEKKKPSKKSDRTLERTSEGARITKPGNYKPATQPERWDGNAPRKNYKQHTKKLRQRSPQIPGRRIRRSIILTPEKTIGTHRPHGEAPMVRIKERKTRSVLDAEVSHRELRARKAMGKGTERRGGGGRRGQMKKE